MQSIKNYTDLEQSRKLAEILPIESADMLFQLGEDKYADSIRVHLTNKHWEQMMPDINPCWSLSALLGVFPWYEINNNGVNILLSVKGEALITEKGECLLDLVVNMIIHLHELKML